MSCRVIAPSAFQPMPWRNGGGTTYEIAAGRFSDAAEGWEWRLSLAEIAQDGPFSRFPHVDRLLTMLSGDGIALSLDGGAEQVLRPLDHIAFAGEAAVACRLLGGPSRDLNLMLDRRRATYLAGQSAAGAEAARPEAPLLLVYGVAGAVAATTGWSEAVPDGAVAIIERETGVTIQGHSIWAAIAPLPAASSGETFV